MDQQKQNNSGFDSRTLLVIFLCLGIWWSWQQYLEKKYPETMGPKTGEVTREEKSLPQPPGIEAEEKKIAAGEGGSVAGSLEAKKGPEQFWNYEDSHWKISVSSYGGRVASVQLKEYTDKEGKPIELLVPQLPGFLLTSIEGGPAKASLESLDYKISPLSQTEVELTAQNAGVSIKKTLTIEPDKYIVKARTELTGATEGIKRVNVDVSEPSPRADEGSKTVSFLNRGAGQELQEFFFSHGSKNNRHLVTGKDPVTKNYDQTNFAALGSRYFTALLFNRSGVLPTGEAFPQGANSTLRLSYPVLDARSPINVDYELYAGPKVLNQLKEVDESAADVVDHGFFSWIALPLLKLMKFLYEVFHNYGVAIIVLTILVRALTFPFTYISMKSMKAMQKIQPEMTRLREIHKDNPQKMNAEVMRVMRENKVNPMGGCLPMLLQLPVFWALYQVLQNSIELYHSPFIFWIHDLSMKDPYYVLPVLMGCTMFLQQKLTPTTVDPQQAKVMLIMPIFFSFLMLSLPSGLTLYIFVSTLFGIFQQLFVLRDRTPAGQVVVRRS